MERQQYGAAVGDIDADDEAVGAQDAGGEYGDYGGDAYGAVGQPAATDHAMERTQSDSGGGGQARRAAKGPCYLFAGCGNDCVSGTYGLEVYIGGLGKQGNTFHIGGGRTNGAPTYIGVGMLG